MQRVGSILKKFVSDHGLETALTLTAVKNQWTELVGQTIAAHTYPDVIKGRTIFINVDTPQWMHHLGFYKEEICQKLERYAVKELKFRIGRIPERTKLEQGTDEIHLTGEDVMYIEDTVKDIKDAELKERLKKLLRDSLTHRKR